MEDYTYSKNSSSGEFEVIPEGDYEATIEEAKVKQTTSGKEYLQLKYRIRNDVEGQKYGNRVVFETIWKTHDDPDHFNVKRINRILDTMDIKDGTVFKGIDDVLKTIEGHNLIVHVKVEFDDYRQKDVNTVYYYKTSKNQPQKLGSGNASAPKEIEPTERKGGFEAKPKAEPKTEESEFSDEDLPF